MAAVTAKLDKELRDKTGAGMMDCKKALAATDGDTDKAVEWLRQKGIASAEKKSGRTAAEGSIGSYIHTGARVGVLIEINCETDFVARGDMFQELLRDVSMQVAACPNVEYVTTDEIPAEISEREKAIEMGRDDLEGKPEKMKEKIVEGRIAKRLKELALMEQPFIKDSSITVAELVKQAAGKIGENVKVRRFTRYTLGEGIEVEDNDFAAEVASMQHAGCSRCPPWTSSPPTIPLNSWHSCNGSAGRVLLLSIGIKRFICRFCAMKCKLPRGRRCSVC